MIDTSAFLIGAAIASCFTVISVYFARRRANRRRLEFVSLIVLVGCIRLRRAGQSRESAIDTIVNGTAHEMLHANRATVRVRAAECSYSVTGSLITLFIQLGWLRHKKNEPPRAAQVKLLAESLFRLLYGSREGLVEHVKKLKLLLDELGQKEFDALKREETEALQAFFAQYESTHPGQAA